jgi:hypothetical protein
MAGLVPAIHVLSALAANKKDVDARHKAGHDEKSEPAETKPPPSSRI